MNGYIPKCTQHTQTPPTHPKRSQYQFPNATNTSLTAVPTPTKHKNPTKRRPQDHRKHPLKLPQHPQNVTTPPLPKRRLHFSSYAARRGSYYGPKRSPTPPSKLPNIPTKSQNGHEGIYIGGGLRVFGAMITSGYHNF